MVLYMIGLGLGNEKDITVKGLEIVKRCHKVYLESYTAILGVDRQALATFYGRPVEDADRERVEQDDEASEILVSHHELFSLLPPPPVPVPTYSALMNPNEINSSH